MHIIYIIFMLFFRRKAQGTSSNGLLGHILDRWLLPREIGPDAVQWCIQIAMALELGRRCIGAPRGRILILHHCPRPWKETDLAADLCVHIHSPTVASVGSSLYSLWSRGWSPAPGPLLGRGASALTLTEVSESVSGGLGWHEAHPLLRVW